MDTHISLAELRRERDELKVLLAEKEAEANDLRSRRNAFVFAIGLLEGLPERNSRSASHRKTSF